MGCMDDVIRVMVTHDPNDKNVVNLAVLGGGFDNFRFINDVTDTTNSSN